MKYRVKLFDVTGRTHTLVSDRNSDGDILTEAENLANRRMPVFQDDDRVYIFNMNNIVHIEVTEVEE